MHENDPSGQPSASPNRRTVLKGLGAGAAGVAAFPLIAACTGGSKPSSGSGAGTAVSSSSGSTSAGAASSASTAVAKSGGSFSFGSNASDAKPKAAIAALIAAFDKQSGAKGKINSKAHNDFQNQIGSYLNGSPDDAFTWFAGYRMRYYAKKGLVAPIDDVWQKIGAANFGPGIVAASTADDGKKYFVPNYNYPWAFFYRKSFWAAKGYTVPKTFDALKALCKQMQKDGITPIAFGDKDGWPAMGTFDYLNMRLNGYQFHVDLMAHKQSWDQPKVKAVFDNWKSILPFQDKAALGLTWQDASTTMANKKAGMYLLGAFVTQNFSDPKVVADIDFFQFPMMTEANGQLALEAPIDGFMLSKKGSKNQVARDLLAYLGSAPAQTLYASIDTGTNIPTNKMGDLSKASPLAKKAQKTIAEAKYISQFLDRDALPAMANNVMIPALQTFIKTGQYDTKSLEKQAKALYASQ
jgi:multiple sugar transport system substrate-binding protein